MVGGGITGCATAYFLARSGVDVTLLERFDLNTLASGRNAGGLHGQIQHEPFLELGEQWAREFGPALELLRDSIRLWQQLERDLGTTLEVDVCGGLLVAADVAQLRDLDRKAAIDREFGGDVELLDRTALRRVAPYVAEDMAGALLCRLEGKANPLLAAPTLARAAAESGARVLIRTEIVDLEQEDGGWRLATTRGELLCDHIVDASGAEAGRLAGLVGVLLPVEGQPIQAAVTEPAPPLVRHLLSFAGGRLTLKQARIGSLLIGGGWPAVVDPESGRVTVDVEALAENVRQAVMVVPRCGGASLVRAWTGVCPALPDHLPILGDVAEGFHVGMFPFLGFTGGPIVARILAALVLGEEPGYDLRPFDPLRFVPAPPPRERSNPQRVV